MLNSTRDYADDFKSFEGWENLQSLTYAFSTYSSIADAGTILTQKDDSAGDTTSIAGNTTGATKPIKIQYFK